MDSAIQRLNNWSLVFTDKDDKPEVLSHNSLKIDNCGGRKRTHALFEKSKVIPGGEEAPPVGDLEVLLCPFPLGNCKHCPVEWNKS